MELQFNGATPSGGTCSSTPTNTNCNNAINGGAALSDHWDDTDTGDEDWWAYDYGAGNTVTVSSVNLIQYWDGDGNKVGSFVVDSSDDGSAWTQRYTATIAANTDADQAYKTASLSTSGSGGFALFVCTGSEWKSKTLASL